ncbi:flagellar hook assembly protein FlgD [Aliiglaciecola sp. CAU 1673]|uniref:flagellar hook assembly protein FlgD n=1 Tax=Aliiglaciecola sp. CAU 1673 TaxID=3032595 RepID=UPI0023DCBFD4|nr:flagellar hook assembly protein FlgD [Aliiglaciecola sp. CAU 1673]MDF2178326.1 flagellar hook assembly protein FlgD [Aliiglaciecola sp. CAU 1673]
MNTINNSNLSNLRWQEETGVPENKNGQLTQEDFFSLLTEQLSMQDPTKPVDNDQMIAQMTSFTMADSLNKLNTNFENFAASMTSNQALQASSLIGQNVLVLGNQGVLKSGSDVSGVIVNEKAGHEMKITIENGIGQTVRVLELGSNQPGNIEFSWDGTDGRGNVLPPGDYKFTARAKVGNEVKEVPLAMHRHVNSVSLASSSQGVILNLSGNQSIKLTDVLEIGG